jgi:hypothetical protein
MTVRLPSFAIPFALLLALVPVASAASPENEAEIRALRAQLAQMKGDTKALQARLRELEVGSDTGSPSSAARDETTAHMQVSPQPTMHAAMTATSTPTYTPTGPALRQTADPAPYEAAVDTRIAMFRVAFSLYRWVPVGSRQLVVFNTYDQAYLLDFANDCPGLLYAKRIEIQNFSTRVRIGEHAVIADGQHCLITNISELRISKLPKALRP